MRLTEHDQLQLTEAKLLDLLEEVLRRLSVKLLHDLEPVQHPRRSKAKNAL